jgi:transposase
MLRLRMALREFFPTALAAYEDLTAPDTLVLLDLAPDPATAKALTTSQIAAALRQANRHHIAIKADTIVAALAGPYLPQSPPLTAAYAAIVRTQTAVLTAINTQIAVLEQQVEGHFNQHPHAAIYLSQPGLGPILGARLLAEFGDDTTRYRDARARKNYAATSPITHQSGKKQTVHRRYVHNDRLIDALNRQAFCSLQRSPGARSYYDALRRRGTSHNAALRQLANRFVGILHGCLKTGTTYHERLAWPAHTPGAKTTTANYAATIPADNAS